MFLLLVDSSDSAAPLAGFDIQMISTNSVLDSAKTVFWWGDGVGEEEGREEGGVDGWRKKGKRRMTLWSYFWLMSYVGAPVWYTKSLSVLYPAGTAATRGAADGVRGQI